MLASRSFSKLSEGWLPVQCGSYGRLGSSAAAAPLAARGARFRVMRAVAVTPKFTQQGLAALLGVSLGRAHYCFAALVNVGWVKIDDFRSSSNKRQYEYILNPSGIVAVHKGNRRRSPAQPREIGDIRIKGINL